MEAVIFCGIPGTGKSTFYRERFFETHIRINLDMLRTRNRERIMLRACLAARQPFVVDNTNGTVSQRAVYLQAAKAAGFHVSGYYFESSVADALRRNQARAARQRVPKVGILSAYKRLQVPSRQEGFDALYSVRIVDTAFVVEEWRDEA
jgi:predicted kinase